MTVVPIHGSIATHPRGLGAFDNLAFETRGSGQEFLSFLALHPKRIERGDDNVHKGLPVSFANAESFVSGLHIASSIEGRTAKRRRQEIDH